MGVYSMFLCFWPAYCIVLAAACWRAAYRQYARACGPMMIEVMKARRETAKILEFGR